MAVDRTTGVGTDISLDLDIIGRLTEIYAETERRIAADIARRLAAGMDSPTWAQDKLAAAGALRRQMQALMARAGADTTGQVAQSLALAYMRGGDEALRELGRQAVSPGSGLNAALQRVVAASRADATRELALAVRAFPGLGNLQRLVFSLASRLSGTHLPVVRWALDAYRDVIGQAALPSVLLGTANRRAASQQAWSQLLGQGIKGFTDKSGREWNLATYVEMATRTGVAQAAVEGHLDRLTDADIDLVIVSNAPQECERCRPWEGKVLARSGPTGRRTVQVLSAVSDDLVEVEIWGTVDEAIAAGLLHPNCRHSLSGYLPGATRIPTNTEDPDGDAARQHLRGLEREVRKLKLQQAGSLDPKLAATYDADIRAKQAEIREHVKATAHLGIMRKREREQLDLGNTTGEKLGRPAKAPKPTPGPKPSAAKPKPVPAVDELTSVREVATSQGAAAKKYAAEQAAKAAPPAVADRAKPYHRNVDGIEDLAHTVETKLDGATRTPIIDGAMGGAKEKITLPDGTAIFRKAFSAEEKNARRMVDAEQLGARLGQVLGAPVPRAYRPGEHEVYTDWVDGKTVWNTKRTKRTKAALDSPAAKRLSLLDLLMSNSDRHQGNLLVTTDGGLVGIDQGNAWLIAQWIVQDAQLHPIRLTSRILGYQQGPALASFADHLQFRANPLTSADVIEIRRRLNELRPEFELLGRGEWLDSSLIVLEQLALHAAGTRSIFDD